MPVSPTEQPTEPPTQPTEQPPGPAPAQPAGPRRPTYPIDSVDHVLRLLDLLRANPDVRVAGVARELGVANSTAHRLLAMLVYRGFVVRDPATHTYRSGPTLVHIGLAALANFDIRRKARPYLERLVGQTAETASLVVLEGPTVRFVDAVESPCRVRVGSMTGAVMPAHATSGGKAILGALTDETILQMYPDDQLAQLTGATIQTRVALLGELAEVRRTGYAVNESESSVGLTAVGLAVCDDRGHPLAALSIAAPTNRLPGAAVLSVAEHLRSAATDLRSTLAG